jgi:tRNA-specific 2-thiouridylase
LTSNSCELIDFNWINGIPKSNKVKVRFRHRQKLISASFEIKEGQTILSYDSTLAVTPGQFAVLYQKNICLGGGIVNKLNNPIIQ